MLQRVCKRCNITDVSVMSDVLFFLIIISQRVFTRWDFNLFIFNKYYMLQRVFKRCNITGTTDVSVMSGVVFIFFNTLGLFALFFLWKYMFQRLFKCWNFGFFVFLYVNTLLQRVALQPLPHYNLATGSLHTLQSPRCQSKSFL